MPVMILLIIAGMGLYFLILSSVEEFTNRTIRQGLQSMADGIFSIADRSIDQLSRKGQTGNEKTIRISQVSALIEIEDFVRKNDLGVLVYELDKQKAVLQTGSNEEANDYILKNVGELDFRLSLPGGGTYYSYAFEFLPWNWRVVLVKDASEYASLVAKTRNFYLIAAGLLLLIGGLLIYYLRRVIARPIHQMVLSLRKHKKSDYAGISEFEFLSDSIGEMMQEVDESREHLEELVQARTAQLEQAHEDVVEKNKTLEALSAKLSKYLSPQVYSSIFSGAQSVELSSKRKKLTVLFSDIVGFTVATDKMQSEELTQLLNLYLSEMSMVALQYGATIDKYIGDAIMIFFGDPESRGVKEDALACVKMALAMQERLYELNTIWRDAGIETPLVTRMGIHTGYCTVGNFGSTDRMDYTVIGGAVNRASRLEHEAPAGDILISFETFSLVKDEIDCEELGKIRVRGIAYPVATYKVIDLYENLSAGMRPLHVELPHLTLDVDPTRMPGKERGEAAQALQDVLKRLEDGSVGPHSPGRDREACANKPLPTALSRPGGKLGAILTALETPAGATLDELTVATGWRRKTVGGALSKLRKRGFGIELRETNRRKTYHVNVGKPQ